MRKLLLTVLLVAATGATAQTPSMGDKPPPSPDKDTADGKFAAAQATETEAGWARAPVAEAATTTVHTIKLASGTIRYKATAGMIPSAARKARHGRRGSPIFPSRTEAVAIGRNRPLSDV